MLSSVVLRSQTDARLAALAAEGNQPAFTAIVERYERELRAHAARIVRPDRAEDVAQQAMLRAWTALLAGSDVGDLRPWMHRIVHNAALDTVARRGYDDGAIPSTATAAHLTEELAEGRLTAGQAIAAIAALPESQRRALTLTTIEGQSGRDAALAMGISESAIRQLVYRARSGIRSAVTAVVPLPLITWLSARGGAATAVTGAAGLGAAGGGSTATTGAAGLGAAGGVAAKAVAVLAVAGATLSTADLVTTRRDPRPPHGLAQTQAPAAASSAGSLRSGRVPGARQASFVSQQLQQVVERANGRPGPNAQGPTDGEGEGESIVAGEITTQSGGFNEPDGPANGTSEQHRARARANERGQSAGNRPGPQQRRKSGGRQDRAEPPADAPLNESPTDPPLNE